MKQICLTILLLCTISSIAPAQDYWYRLYNSNSSVEELSLHSFLIGDTVYTVGYSYCEEDDMTTAPCMSLMKTDPTDGKFLSTSFINGLLIRGDELVYYDSLSHSFISAVIDYRYDTLRAAIVSFSLDGELIRDESFRYLYEDSREYYNSLVCTDSICVISGVGERPGFLRYPVAYILDRDFRLLDTLELPYPWMQIGHTMKNSQDEIISIFNNSNDGDYRTFSSFIGTMDRQTVFRDTFRVFDYATSAQNDDQTLCFYHKSTDSYVVSSIDTENLWNYKKVLYSIDRAGNIIWVMKDYEEPGPLSYDDVVYLTLHERPNGDILAGGSCTWDGKYLMPYLCCVSPSGEKKWERIYGRIDTPGIKPYQASLENIMENENGDIYLTGIGLSLENSLALKRKPFIIKTDSIGCYNYDCGVYNLYTATKEVSIVPEELVLSPNPVSDILYFTVPKSIKGRANIIVRDIEGNIVQTGTSLGDNHYLDVSRLSSGNYLAEFWSKQRRFVGRFVKL